MKKLVLFAAVIVALSFASCKQKVVTPPTEVEVDEVVLTDDEVPADTIVAIEVEEAE